MDEKTTSICIGVLVTLFFMSIFSVIIYLLFFRKKENMSIGTIQQLFSKDVQDYHLNGGSIQPIVTDNYLLAFNQPTLITQRSLMNNMIDKSPIVENNNDCQRLDFLNNGKCGKIFFNNQFLPINNNGTIYTDQYTGHYI